MVGGRRLGINLDEVVVVGLGCTAEVAGDELADDKRRPGPDDRHSTRIARTNQSSTRMGAHREVTYNWSGKQSLFAGVGLTQPRR